MKKVIISLVVIGALIGPSAQSYASDWDKAGKALAVIEGVRIITGGNVDLIGNITGISKNNSRSSTRSNNNRSYAKNYSSHTRRARTWVPHYVWEKQYVPEHEEYSEGYGNIIVEGHYIRYQVEEQRSLGIASYSQCRGPLRAPYHKNYNYCISYAFLDRFYCRGWLLGYIIGDTYDARDLSDYSVCQFA